MEVDEKKILIQEKTSWNILRGVQNIIHVLRRKRKKHAPELISPD